MYGIEPSVLNRILVPLDFFPPMVQTSETVLKLSLETLTAGIARETIVFSLCVFYWFSSNCILKGQDGLHFGFA